MSSTVLRSECFCSFFPWSNVWDQNSLLSYYPNLKLIVLNNFFRGAVSGLGLANLLLGFWEVSRLNRYFRKARAAGLTARAGSPGEG